MFLFSMTVTNSPHVTIVPLNLPWSSPQRKDVGPWITTFVLPGRINFFQPGSLRLRKQGHWLAYLILIPTDK